jgi:hypothetical protein
MTIRRLLLALLVVGLIVTGTDLLLLDHHEDAWQLIPLILIGLALGVVVWHLAARDATSLRALQAAMVLFLFAAATGIVLHYRGNMEFQLEMDPTQSNWTLFNKVIRAKAPPAMAPSVMAQLGLIGLIYSYRHPVLEVSREAPGAAVTGAGP